MFRINFVELPSKNFAESKQFYADAFGVALTGFGPTYACTLTGDVDLGLQGDPTEATAAPLPVIDTLDIEASLAAVIKAGGVITRPVFSFPGGRRFQFRDPSGNELAVAQAV